MGETELIGSEPTYFKGSVVRDGKIFAQNMRVNVEERYPTAYNLGCGDKHWANWINVDAFALDADLCCDLRALSIGTDSADAVAAIHVLEHFYEWEALDLIREWRRILKPGGKMILELPCMDKVFGYVARCVKHKEPMHAFMTTHALWGDPKHKSVPMTHKVGYFTEQLVRLLGNAGMREIQVCEARYHFKFRDFRVECIK